jgi:signal-transduction protein with cAMP-binding, CBS, and nucleotidyltransferase domain
MRWIGVLLCSVVAKSPATTAMIKSCLSRKNLLFSSLEPELLDAVVDSMDLYNVPENTVVIREGDEATEFYVVDSGYLDVLEDGIKVSCVRPWFLVCLL